MKSTSKGPVFLISGKNPLNYHGGYASYSNALAKNLTKINVEVEIFCIGEKTLTIKSKIGLIHVVGAKTLLRIFKNTEMAGLVFFAPILALNISKRIKAKSPILIWGVGPWSFAGLICNFISRQKITLFSDYFTTLNHEFAGTLASINFEDYGFEVFKNKIAYYLLVKPYSYFENLLFAFSDRIIIHYKSTQKIISNEMKISPQKFIRLPYSISQLPNLKSSRKFGSKVPKILLISRHDARKGINYLLHAFKILESRGIKYKAVIAGGGQLLAQNKRLLRKLGLINVKIIGRIEDKTKLLNSSDIFVFPSVEEGSGSLSILEATSYGLAIVSTNIDGIPEDLWNNYSALLIPPKNSKALADAIEKLIKDPNLAKNLGINAKKEFHNKHNPIIVRRELKMFIFRVSQY